MNDAIRTAGWWVFIAGLLNAGRASLLFNSDGRPLLAVTLRRDAGEAVCGKLREQGLKVQIVNGRHRDYIRLRLIGSEVMRVLAKTHDLIFDPWLKRRSDILQRWWSTVEVRGVHLSREKRAARAAAIRDLKKLKKAQ